LARFIFRLERVLKLKKRIEEGSQREFSKRRAELLRVESEMDDVKEKLREFIKKNPYTEGVFTATEIIWLDNYINKSHISIKNLTEQQKEKKEKVIEALADLKEAKKERKVFENLKDRLRERYLQEEQNTENKELDDINQKIGLNREKLTLEDVPLEDM
jgi:flagellar export protein FliJ